MSHQVAREFLEAILPDGPVPAIVFENCRAPVGREIRGKVQAEVEIRLSKESW